MYKRQHHDAGKRDQASSELLAFAANQAEVGETTSNGESRDSILEELLRYPEEHGLPSEPFIGRVRAAMKELRSVGTSRQSDVERRVLYELRGRRDSEVVAKIAMEK